MTLGGVKKKIKVQVKSTNLSQAYDGTHTYCTHLPHVPTYLPTHTHTPVHHPHSPFTTPVVQPVQG